MPAFTCDAPCQELARWAISIAIPATAGLVGVVIGAWLAGQRERRQRKLNYLENQLSDFYSPMLGLRNEIRMHSELRVRIQDASNGAWLKLCAEAREVGNEALTRLTKDRGSEFTSGIAYDNEKLQKELLPAYRQMAKLFREKLWLADAVTQSHYENLIEFVEVWDRWIAKAMPAEVLERLDHSEEKLSGFYEHLQKTHDALRQRLQEGKA